MCWYQHAARFYAPLPVCVRQRLCSIVRWLLKASRCCSQSAARLTGHLYWHLIPAKVSLCCSQLMAWVFLQADEWMILVDDGWRNHTPGTSSTFVPVFQRRAAHAWIKIDLRQISERQVFIYVSRYAYVSGYVWHIHLLKYDRYPCTAWLIIRAKRYINIIYICTLPFTSAVI